MNAQTQQIIEWPAVPVVARAYLDQLQRDNTISPRQASGLREVLGRAETLLSGGDGNRRSTARELNTLADDFSAVAGNYSGIAGTRYTALAETLEGIADSL